MTAKGWVNHRAVLTVILLRAMARPLILDGITIQLAGELFFDAGTEFKERARTKVLYGNALCDLSFAVLFGDNLGSVGSLGRRSSPGSTKIVSPGQLLIDYDKEAVFRTKIGSAPGKVEDILKVESVRSTLMDDLEAISGDFGRASGLHELWAEYIQNEAETNLSPEPVRNPSADDRTNESFCPRYLYPRRDPPYLFDGEIQSKIRPGFVRLLIASIKKKQEPSRSDEDLDEFVRRVTLGHYTISQWYESNATSANFVRMSFSTRSILRFYRALARAKPGDEAKMVHRLKGADIRLRSSAMADVFSRYRRIPRLDVYSALVDRRSLYAQHRECLADIDEYSREESFNARRVERAKLALDNLLGDNAPQRAIHDTDGNVSNLSFEQGSNRVPIAAFEIFPELSTMSKETRQTNFYGPVGTAVTGDNNTIYFSSTQMNDIRRLMDMLDAHLSELQMTHSDAELVRSQMATIDLQLADTPDPTIIREAGKTLRQLIEGVAGNLAAAVIIGSHEWAWILDKLKQLF